MKKRMTLWQRAVAMVLALQMTAAPVAMARATDLLFVSVTGEQAMLTSANTAEVGDTGTAGATDPTYQLDQDAGQYFVDGNASLLNTVALTGTRDVKVSRSMGMPVTQFDGWYLDRFHVGGNYYVYGAESTLGLYEWGHELIEGRDRVFVDGAGENYYFALPTAEEIGRVPDLEFDGFYLYRNDDLYWFDKEVSDEAYMPNGGDKFSDESNGNTANTWDWEQYAEQDGFKETDPLVSSTYPDEGDLVSVPAKEAHWTEWEHLSEDAKADYNDYYEEYGYDSAEDMWLGEREFDSTGGIPVIGMWKKSTIARFTDFGFTWRDAAGEAISETAAARKVIIYDYDASKVEDSTLADAEFYPLDEATVLSELETADSKYFIQVTSDITQLDLSFVSYEPYWDYHMDQEGDAACPVTVTVKRSWGTEEGETLTLESSEMGTVTMETVTTEGTGEDKVVEVGGSFEPVDTAEPETTYPTPPDLANSATKPARARWTLPTIDLTMPETENAEKITTEVTITLTAPDGTTKRQVTFLIRELEDPLLIKAPGNTPFGMIDRDTSSVWGPEGDEATRTKAKEDAKDSFAQTHQFDFASKKFPQDDVYHQGGQVFRSSYTARMWNYVKMYQYNYKDDVWEYAATGNLDLRSDAIVVYQDTAALDPGITLYASHGVTDVVPLEHITATVTVLVADESTPLTPDLVGATAGTGGVKTEELKLRWVKDEETGEEDFIIDLRGRKVLPGVYSIEYSYRDWFIGADVNSGSGEEIFADTTLAANFKRPLVVLPAPGDVDMDGAVTHADAVALEEYLASDYDGTDSAVALFLHRVCDVTHDGTVDDKDVDELEGGFHPEVHKPDGGGSSDYWYIPLPLPDEDGDTSAYTYSRKTWGALNKTGETETASLLSRFLALFSTEETTGATISLEYLGVEQGTALSTGTTSGATGPWEADPDSEVALGAYNKENNEGEVFWMGVKLSDTAKSSLLAGKQINSLTLTVTYDSRYVTPTYVVRSDDDGWDLVSNKTDEEKWEYSVTRYNLGALADKEKTLWGGNGAYSLTSAAGYDLGYTTHYSKVVSHLEQTLEEEDDSEYLKQLTFSVSLGAERMPVMMEDGYLAALPFKLIKHPFGESDLEAVELSAGMQELNLITVDPTSTVAETVTAAFSAQDAIFGDSTQNLRAQTGGVTYADVLPAIPLGTNNTKAYTLEPAYYGTEVTYDNSVEIPFNGEVNEGSVLPDGLIYDPVAQTLSGTPTEVGKYEFEIADRLYYLEVKKKEIRCSVTSATTYYGETEYRGFGGDGDFTFTYTVDDLYEDDKKLAAEKGVILAGNGTELYDLFFVPAEGDNSYRVPTFTAWTDSTHQTPVDYGTAANRSYDITTQYEGFLKNYQLVFNNTGKTLTIDPRPVVVYAISSTNVGETYMDVSATTKFPGTGSAVVGELTEDSAPNRFTLAFPDSFANNGVNPPTNGAAWVEGDILTVSYTASWLRVKQDEVQSSGFYLEKSREYRPVELHDLKLGGADADNYDLQEYTLQTNPAEGMEEFKVTVGDGGRPEGYSGAYGVVMGRVVTDIEIQALPSYFDPNDSFDYGATLTGAEKLMLNIYTGIQVHGTYGFTEKVAADWKIHVNFVTAEEMEAGKNSTGYEGTGRDGNGEDLNPYYEGLILTHAQHNGRYLCVSVAVTQDDGSTVVIRDYSDHPIKVEPLVLTLRAADVTRYYGEPNGDLTYTYDPNELAPHDAKRLSELRTTDAWKDIVKGSGEELEKLLAELGYDSYDPNDPDKPYYTVPTMSAVTTTATPVPVEVGLYTAAGTPCEIRISGAATAVGDDDHGKPIQGNYKFRYANSGEPDVYSESMGKASLTIERRRVVVEDLTEAGKKRVFDEVKLYADTMDITATTATAANRGATLTLDLKREVTLTTPDKTDTGGIYFHENNGTTTGLVTRNYPMSKTTILENDWDDLKLTYTATVVPDSGVWTNFGAGYFSTGLWDEGENSALYPVQIGSLTLTGAPAANYQLVYKSAGTAQTQTPANAEKKAVTAPAVDGTGRTTYYPSTEVEVWRRPVKSLVISVPPTMRYTSGDLFHPASGLEVEVQYSTDYDNCDDNLNSETVSYQNSGIVNGEFQTTFDERGFTIGYLESDESLEQLEGMDKAELEEFLAEREIDQNTELTRVKHNGARIFVAGTNSAGERIFDLTERTLEVEPRTLTLTVNDVHRFYGEPNSSGVSVVPSSVDAVGTRLADLTFTFDVRQLSAADQAALSGAAKINKNIIMYGAAALAVLGMDVAVPTLDNAAKAEQDSPSAAGSYVSYPITAPEDSEVGNYRLEWVDGSLYVYPRPVQVTGFDNSDGIEDWPIYTIYNDLNTRTVTTNIPRVETITKTVGGEEIEEIRQRFFLGMPRTGTSYEWKVANGAEYALPLTGTAIYGYGNENLDEKNPTIADNLTIKATVIYPEYKLPTGSAIHTYEVTLENFSLVPGSANYDNYYLLNENTADNGSVGAVALRKLVAIRVVKLPDDAVNQEMRYTYGESLNLDGLAVEITYGMLENDVDNAREKVTVSYYGPDQFEGYGLYVDYSEKGAVEDQGALGVDEEDVGYWDEIIDTWRSADSGDHLTIAPSHDYYGGKAFAHNNQFLIISGRLHGEHDPVKPVIVSVINDLTGNSGLGVYGEPIPIKVDPLKLTFTLLAEDKTYDGTTDAAGTLVLTNVFNRPGDFVDAYNPNGVTDVVFVRTGADYESPEGDITDHRIYGDFKAHVADKGYTFTTGSYEPNGPWPLGANGTIRWADGYRDLLGQPVPPDYLTFSFVNPNVRYEDDEYDAAVASVTKYGNSYWRVDQAANTPGGASWDTFGTVAAMPVEVTGMVLAGPDAANYTWGWDETEETWTDKTTVTMSTRDSAVDGQDAVPFATIHKANRMTIWDAWAEAGGATTPTPTVAVDRHTNVVQVTWELDAGKMEEDTAYTGENHFEYALIYVDSDGQLRQWAGNDGAAGWQDTLYFGGEFVDPGVPGGYVPDPDDLPTAEDVAEEDYVFKGQIYRWLDDDDGVRIDAGAYPNDKVQLGYALLASDRAALPRDTVFWPIVRAAETHNYLSSPVLSGDESLTAELVDAWMKAVAAYDAEPTPENEAAVKLAADAVIKELDNTKQDAIKAADKEVADLTTLAAEGDWPEDNIWTDPDPTAAVKTFRERIDVISIEETESFDESDETEYRVPTLEAVWFTDLMEYPEEDYMDVVLRNNEPTRYYGYYWDQWMSAEMEFDEEAPINLSGPISDIPVEYEDENGDKVETTITVNTNGTLKLYVNIDRGGGGIPIRDFFVEPSYIVARVGDEPIELTITFIPEDATHTRLSWVTSDPAVATAKNGIVTIVGPGTATITALTQNGHRREIQVLVLTAEQLWGGIFNWSYTDAWFDLEKDGMFYPLREMTRGEVAWTLSKLYVPSETWTRSGPSYFSDLTGEEYYYDAAILLGSEGVILGMPGGEFQGEKTITRGEFAAMMARMMDLPMPDAITSEAIYSDVAVGEHWAWGYIHAMSAVGAMHGVGDGKFAPDAILTRAEAATVIARLLHKQIDTEQKDWVVPLDVSEPDWFYWYVVRAVNNIGAVSDLVE